MMFRRLFCPTPALSWKYSCVGKVRFRSLKIAFSCVDGNRRSCEYVASRCGSFEADMSCHIMPRSAGGMPFCIALERSRAVLSGQAGMSVDCTHMLEMARRKVLTPRLCYSFVITHHFTPEIPVNLLRFMRGSFMRRALHRTSRSR